MAARGGRRRGVSATGDRAYPRRRLLHFSPPPLASAPAQLRARPPTPQGLRSEPPARARSASLQREGAQADRWARVRARERQRRRRRRAAAAPQRPAGAAPAVRGVAGEQAGRHDHQVPAAGEQAGADAAGALLGGAAVDRREARARGRGRAQVPDAHRQAGAAAGRTLPLGAPRTLTRPGHLAAAGGAGPRSPRRRRRRAAHSRCHSLPPLPPARPQCSFFEHRQYRIVYRRYASLFFVVGVDADEARRRCRCLPACLPACSLGVALWSRAAAAFAPAGSPELLRSCPPPAAERPTRPPSAPSPHPHKHAHTPTHTTSRTSWPCWSSYTAS